MADPDTWRNFHDQFMKLVGEEQTAFAGRPQGFHPMQADVTYDADEIGDYGSWILSFSLNANFRAWFELIATRAGIALGAPPNVTPLYFWLDRLFRWSTKNTRHVAQGGYCAGSPEEKSGAIYQLFEASATYCSWLEKEALEKPAALPAEPEAGQQVQPQPADAAGTGGSGSPTVGANTIKRRREIVRQYNRKHGLTMAALSRGVAISVSGIQAIIRGDRSRYSQENCNSFLKKIGVRRGQWDKE